MPLSRAGAVAARSATRAGDSRHHAHSSSTRAAELAPVAHVDCHRRCRARRRIAYHTFANSTDFALLWPACTHQAPCRSACPSCRFRSFTGAASPSPSHAAQLRVVRAAALAVPLPVLRMLAHSQRCHHLPEIVPERRSAGRHASPSSVLASRTTNPLNHLKRSLYRFNTSSPSCAPAAHVSASTRAQSLSRHQALKHTPSRQIPSQRATPLTTVRETFNHMLSQHWRYALHVNFTARTVHVLRESH